jgi:hypothetical protein
MIITISAGANLTPGTYFFVNSSLVIQGGTVQCLAINPQTKQKFACDGADGGVNDPNTPGSQGVTLVLSGSPASLTIGTGATVLLSAPACASFPSPTASSASCSSPLNGILFYRASTAVTDSSTAPSINIADGGADFFNGGMYFPNAYVTYSGNINTNNPPTCAILAGGYLNLGSSQFGSTCGAYNTPTPMVQTAQLLQ